MLKKTVVLGSLLTLISASSTLAHGYFKSGFLAGAHVGISSGWGKFNSTFSVPALPGGDNNSSANGTTRKTAPLIGILGGYRHIFNEGYTLGFNLEANFFANNELNKKLEHFTNPPPGIPFNNRLKKSFNVIPSINFGKIFCGRYHVSLGLGFSIARFKQQVDLVALDAPPVSASTSQTKIGFIPSLGLEYAATQNVSLIGSISYEIYNKMSKTFINSGFGTSASYKASVSPRYLAFKVGAIYRF